jgi:hypothetical protein
MYWGSSEKNEKKLTMRAVLQRAKPLPSSTEKQCFKIARHRKSETLPSQGRPEAVL